jgi:hypothetical protein
VRRGALTVEPARTVVHDENERSSEKRAQPRLLRLFMPSVLIAVPKVGVGLQLEDALRRAGAKVRWDGRVADGPVASTTPTSPPSDDAAVVIIDADYLGDKLPAVVAAWRASPALPGVVAIGDGEAARTHAPAARVTLLAGKASAPTLVSAVQEAYRLRHAATLSWPRLCAAVGHAVEPYDAAAVSAAAVAEGVVYL